MFFNTFKKNFSLRGLRRQKGFNALNFTGLYASLTMCLLIAILILHERSFDHFHHDVEHLYRVGCILKSPEGEGNLPLIPYPATLALRSEISGVQDLTKVNWEATQVVHLKGGIILQEKNVLYADSSFFDVFSFDAGIANPAKILRQPNQVILTQSTAQRYFPGGNAVGKTFTLGDSEVQTSVEVVGVMPDPPANTHLIFSMLVSAPTLKVEEGAINNWSWFSGGQYTYLRVNGQTQSITQSLNALAKSRKDKGDAIQYRYKLQPMTAIHTAVNNADLNPSYTINFQQFYWLGAIALFLLTIACINYVNLSTAIATRKAKEVGVRKALGANRSQLAMDFLAQTFVLTLSASALAAISAQILLPSLNAFLDRQIEVYWLSPQILLCLGGLCMLTTLLAGLYPAFILAGFRPVEALRGRFSGRSKSTSLNLRRSLVTFQFAIAQVFIAGVIITALQMRYLRNMPLGFNRQNVLNIRLPEVNSAKVTALKTEIGNLSGVKNLTQSMGAPVAKWSMAATVFHLREKYRQTKLQVAIKITDSNYLDTYGISLRAGRFINTNDEQRCLESIPEAERQFVAVINESAVKVLGFASNAEALGQEITIGFNDITLPIVGVVQDFHTTSLHQPLSPTVMLPNYEFKRDLGIAFEPGALTSGTLAAIEKIWKRFYPEQYFESAFLDDHVASLYREESRTFTLFKLATLLALLLNALGLIGLTAFVVEQKTREIGVRKVLGASVASITNLLAKDFIKLALLAIVLATPLAWYAMQQWLTGFAYRIDMRWWMFGLAGTAAVLIAILTIGFQSVRAALANPIESLRSE